MRSIRDVLAYDCLVKRDSTPTILDDAPMSILPPDDCRHALTSYKQTGAASFVYRETSAQGRAHPSLFLTFFCVIVAFLFRIRRQAKQSPRSPISHAMRNAIMGEPHKEWTPGAFHAVCAWNAPPAPCMEATEFGVPVAEPCVRKKNDASWSGDGVALFSRRRAWTRV
mgnify:CR=1 FL=1